MLNFNLKVVKVKIKISPIQIYGAPTQQLLSTDPLGVGDPSSRPLASSMDLPTSVNRGGERTEYLGGGG